MTVKPIQRLVIVVDVRAWILYTNPAGLASLLQRIVRRFLVSASPFCRWAFKLFDSSLSPFSSRCKINKLLGSWACSTRFDSVVPGGDNAFTLPEVFSQFCSALNCLHTELLKIANVSASEASVAAGSASYVASSLQELLVDYTWDPLIPCFEDVSVSVNDVSSIHSNTNLVILFSTIPTSHLELKHFLGVGSDSSEKGFSMAFSSSFKKVHDSFSSNSIHLCWIHIPLNISSIGNGLDVICNNTSYNKLQIVRLLENVGWSFTSLDVLFAGLRLLPFSIIWKSLSHPLFQFCNKPAAGIQKLCIQVKDVRSKSINTTLCKVEAVPIGGNVRESQLSRSVIWVSSTISRKALNLALYSPIFLAILRPHVTEKAKLEQFELMLEDEKDRHFVGDYILRQLQQEGRVFEPGKPAWQMFLLHLAREERLAIIDLRANRLSYFAIIEPLTVHLAVLRVFDKQIPYDILGRLSGIQQESFLHMLGDEDSRPDSDFSLAVSADFIYQETGLISHNKGCKTTKPAGSKRSRLIGSEEQDGTGCNNVRKRIRPSCPAQAEEDGHPTAKMSLEELYLRSDRRSKVLKVFSCWIKQTKEDNIKLDAGVNFHQVSGDIPDQPESQTGSGNIKSESVEPFLDNNPSDKCTHVDDPVDVRKDSSALDIRLSDASVLQESDNVFSTQDSHLCDGKKTLQYAAFDDADLYIASLEKKIAHCLSSPEIDLHCFCQRVITDAYHAFSVAVIRASQSEGGCQSACAVIGSGSGAVVERLSEALLQSPKKLASKYKKCSPPRSDSQGVDCQMDNHCLHTSEEKVREHELQILFRMEMISVILAVSELKDLITGFVNDICKLLENIQFNLPGGVLEGESLFDFSNTAIKERYTEKLPDIVKNIYMIMEFNGHDGLSEAEELDLAKNISEIVPSFSDALNSLGTENDSFNNSDNSRDSCSQRKVKDNSTDVSLSFNDDSCDQRKVTNDSTDVSLINGHSGFQMKVKNNSTDVSLFNGKSRSVGKGSTEDLRLAEAKRERAKRFSHFANSSKDLLRVIVTPKLSISSKKHTTKSNSDCSRRRQQELKKNSDREEVMVMQTPVQSKKSGHKSRKKTPQDKEIIVQTPLQPEKLQAHDPPVGAKKKLLV